MAMGGKTAGILSGLGIGAAAGVMLAAMNPILPRTDTTEVVNLPAEVIPQAPEVGGPQTPSPTTDVAIAAPGDVPAVETPQLDSAAPTAPERPDRASVAPVATAVSDLGAPDPAEDQDLAMVSPEADSAIAATSSGGQGPGRVAPEAAPALDTTTAAPLDVPAPEAATTAPDEPADTVAETAPAGAGTTGDQPLQPEAPASAPDLPADDATAPVAEVAKAPAPQPETPLVASNDGEADPLPASTGTQVESSDIKAEEVNPVGNPGLKLEGQPPRTVGTIKTLGDSGSSRFPQVGNGNNRVAGLGTGGSARFPKIGADTVDAATDAAQTDRPRGGLEANRNAFVGSDRPLLSIVVLDDGRVEASLDALRSLGLPVAIAVAADGQNAPARARALRNAGHEVLAVAPRAVPLSLSGNQDADQVAETLNLIFDQIPDAVGLIDRPEATIQRDRKLARHIVSHFAQSGHGLVTYGGGLNAVPRLAAQHDVSAGQVFRFLDQSGEQGDVVRRYLNRAALEARSKGQVIVMVTPNAATLQAVADWAASPRGRDVALAPVSAALLAGGGG